MKATRETFREMLGRTGGFQRIRSTDDTAGSDVFLLPMSPGLNAFVRLMPSPKPYSDQFMIELGWSAQRSYPSRARLQIGKQLNLCIDGRVRLPSLYRERWKSAIEPRWELGASSLETGDDFYTEAETQRRLARVSIVVDDAIAKLETYGMPFFERAAASRR